MTWLIQRLLIVWLIFCVVCAATIALGRLDHTPTTLQTLGFDTCDGDPCFRGLKPGMDWAFLAVPNYLSSSADLVISQTLDRKFINTIQISFTDLDVLPITMGKLLV